MPWPYSVYIAAPSELIDEARVLLGLLHDTGIGCTSGWIINGLTGDSNESAAADLRDVKRADAVVVMNPPAWKNRGTGGRHVELGYALALNKPVVVVGCRTNVFHYLDSVTVTTTVDQLIANLVDRLPMKVPR